MTPEMLRTIAKTWTHLCHVTLVALEPREAVAVLKDPIVAAVEARVNRLALSGDVLATQRACQDWNRSCQAAMARRKDVA